MGSLLAACPCATSVSQPYTQQKMVMSTFGDNSQRDLVCWRVLDQLNEFYGSAADTFAHRIQGKVLFVGECHVTALCFKKHRKVAKQSYRFANLDIMM